MPKQHVNCNSNAVSGKAIDCLLGGSSCRQPRNLVHAHGNYAHGLVFFSELDGGSHFDSSVHILGLHVGA